jgi:class 3 adenylate cyclase/tetratricopeptide (TPR) repeat protein
VGNTELAGDLISRAQEAVSTARWLDALDLASQALAADPSQSEAAVIVGTARQHLGTVSAAGAELRQLTVVAVDMVQSTRVAARIGPEAMRRLMLDLYEICAEAVVRFEGRVTKYSGDGVLAQFGHPVAHEDDARRAVLSAFAMLEAVSSRSEHWQAEIGEQVQLRAGIDSGVAAVGPMDTSPFSPEEIAGDPPNVATRVQSTAEPMTIRVTNDTNQLIEGWFDTRPVGIVDLRNYPRPIALHEVLGPTEAETRLEAHVRARPSLINRRDELIALRGAWSQVVAAGTRQVVSITGEPGIGKSRLVEHMLGTAVASGALHMTFACSQLHRESPLRPVIRALTRFFRVFPHEGGSEALWLDAVSTRLRQLPHLSGSAEEAVPIFGWLLGIRSAVDLAPEELRRRSFEVIIDLLEAMALNSLLVLSVEDADCADPSTAELLSALLCRPPTPMLVMLTSRLDIPWLESTDQELDLEPLRGGDAAALVRSVAPDLSDSVIKRLAERSDGVPFFAEELARSAGESQRGALAETFELSGFLSARLDELGPQLKQLVGQIAVAGQEIRIDVLESFVELPRDLLDPLVDELLDRRVLVRISHPTGDALRFRHGLIRNVAYGSLLARRRSELHGRIAGMLTALPLGLATPEDVANHHSLAGDQASAAPRWLDAARRATAAGAGAEAAELYRRALSALDQLAPGPERNRLELDAQLGLGSLLSGVQGYTSSDARAAFERAVTLAEGLEETVAVLPALWGAWAYWLVLGEHSVAAGLAERCVRIAGEERNEAARLLAGAINGYQLLYIGKFKRAMSELEMTGTLTRVEPPEAFPHDPALVGMATAAAVRWFLGEPELARRAAEDARARVRELDPENRRTPLTQSFVGCVLAWHAELDGQHEAAASLAEEAAAIATERGYPVWEAAATMHRCISLCSLGRYDEALPMLTALVAAWRMAGQDTRGRQLHPVLMTPYFAGRLAEAQLATGQIDTAVRELDRILGDTAANGERFWDVELLRLRAMAAQLRAPESPEAQLDLAAARHLAEEQHSRSLLDRLDQHSEQATWSR